MVLPQLPTQTDYENRAEQTTLLGRRWTVEIEFYLPADASQEEVLELVEDRLGSSCLQDEHPLYDVDLERGVALSARPDRRGYFVQDWSAQTDDGRRTGRTRYVPDDQVPA